MDYSGSGFPESHPVAGRGAAQEVIDFCVYCLGGREVLVHAVLGADEVVAVDGGGDAGAGLSGVHELKHRHLGRGVLHRNSVGAEICVVRASFERSSLLSWEQVRIEYFLS